MPKDAMHWRHLCEFDPSSLSSTTRQVRRDQRETLGETSRCFCVGTNVATGIMTRKAGLAMILKNTCMRYPHLEVLPIYIQASALNLAVVGALSSNLALFLSYTHETCGRCYHEVQVRESQSTFGTGSTVWRSVFLPSTADCQLGEGLHVGGPI
ncbi:hypothetical protein EDB84DRAFT_1486115 [Lactarius hengduanensis]|nr:hypothetical protein EDB84DRAFT_1486115 [Lactarius hengduanensis]